MWELRNQRQSILEIEWGKVPQRGMDSSAVVEQHVAGYSIPRLLPGFEAVTVDTLYLERLQKAFSTGVVVRTAPRAHALTPTPC